MFTYRTAIRRAVKVLDVSLERIWNKNYISLDSDSAYGVPYLILLVTCRVVSSPPRWRVEDTSVCRSVRPSRTCSRSWCSRPGVSLRCCPGSITVYWSGCAFAWPGWGTRTRTPPTSSTPSSRTSLSPRYGKYDARFCKAVLGIRDILVRIRIPGFVLLTNESGSSSGSDTFFYWL